MIGCGGGACGDGLCWMNSAFNLDKIIKLATNYDEWENQLKLQLLEDDLNILAKENL